jgi:hypothetical protein
MTMTVRVTGGKLDLGFNFNGGNNALKTYLTGMLVEPAEDKSSMTALPEMRDQLNTPPETQTRYESQVASSIATLLEQTAPQAGPNQDSSNPLDQPVQTAQQVSPS